MDPLFIACHPKGAMTLCNIYDTTSYISSYHFLVDLRLVRVYAFLCHIKSLNKSSIVW